jgi:hypothetical protein
MPNDLGFGKPRQADLVGSIQAAKPILKFPRIRKVHAGSAHGTLLEYDRLLVVQAPVSGVGNDPRGGTCRLGAE